MQTPEDDKSTELINIGGETLPEVTRLKAKHFDVLESVLTQLYRHQYRHVSEVSKTKLLIWIGAFALSGLYDTWYADSLSVGDTIKFMFGAFLVLMFVVGVLCIFSKCFTRLAHFKMNLLRLCQLVVGLSVFDDVSHFTLGLAKFLPGYEMVLFGAHYLLILFLSYGILSALVTFKQLRIATWIYLFIGVVLIPSTLLFDGCRHLAFKDNEIFVYANYGADASRKIDSIDSMIDKSVNDLK